MIKSEVEQLMLQNLENNINSNFFLEILKRNWNNGHNIHSLGKLIGEAYTISIINKDGYGFQEYMTQVESLHGQLKEHKISPDNFNLQKSKLICIVIAKKIGIDVTREVTLSDMLKVKTYFLQEYVENGYVSHSFPQAYYESIIENGLISSTEKRNDKPVEIQEIQDIFLNKGVVSPLGGYPYYGGTGIYYEHDFTKVFQHAIDSPEWFNWFTSSDHTTAYHSDIETSPYILRNEEACRQNIQDLCVNAELNLDETKQVISFYEKSYDKFNSPKLNVALISKKFLGKSDVSVVAPQNLDLFATITHVLNDGANQYVEHQGNVYNETISPNNLKISVLPTASKFMRAEHYSRESKAHLTDPKTNLEVLRSAEQNKNRLSISMISKLETAKQLIENKIKNSFPQRSQSEIQIANQIREKNKIIAQQKQMSKQQEKGKTLVKKASTSNNGYVNVLIFSLIISFVAGALFMFIYFITK